MKTSELTGAALDWAVAKCEGADNLQSDGIRHYFRMGNAPRVLGGGSAIGYAPSTNWAQGGPIIERELIDVLHVRQNDLSVAWDATFGNDEIVESGPTLLIAAMRCYCCSKLGDEVEIPEELQ